MASFYKFIVFRKLTIVESVPFCVDLFLLHIPKHKGLSMHHGSTANCKYSVMNIVNQSTTPVLRKCCYVGHKQENYCSRCRVDLVQNTQHVGTDSTEISRVVRGKLHFSGFTQFSEDGPALFFSDQPIRNGPLALWVGKL